MEHWKEILLQDLKNVRKGYEETGKDASKVIQAIEHIPNLDEKAVIQLLIQNDLRYFAAKVESYDYHRNADEESKLAEQAAKTKKAGKNGRTTS